MDSGVGRGVRERIGRERGFGVVEPIDAGEPGLRSARVCETLAPSIIWFERRFVRGRGRTRAGRRRRSMAFAEVGDARRDCYRDKYSRYCPSPVGRR